MGERDYTQGREPVINRSREEEELECRLSGPACAGEQQKGSEAMTIKEKAKIETSFSTFLGNRSQ